LVKDDPKLVEYVIPLFSSITFLALLGTAGLFLIPKFVTKQISVIDSQNVQDVVCLGLMTILVFIYMPLLHYCKASYLTGAFLAGLTFSQIHSMHQAFVLHTSHIMTWLLRIFFAATIGFQIPVKDFFDWIVIGKGLLFYTAVIAKFPLGFLVPTSKDATPKGYPFNPFHRDLSITGFAMTCRGEFSFIIASFARGEELFDNKTYAAVLFAVLLSSVTSPMLLIASIRHFNEKLMVFLNDKGEGKDEKSPLYLMIQLRYENVWGIQSSLQEVMNDLGLNTIDARLWHGKLEETVLAEMHVQDNNIMAFSTTPEDTTEGMDTTSEDRPLVSDNNDDNVIKDRLVEIETSILSVLGETSTVKVEQWFPFSEDTSTPTQGLLDGVIDPSKKEEHDSVMNLLDGVIDLSKKEEHDFAGMMKHTQKASSRFVQEDFLEGYNTFKSRRGKSATLQPSRRPSSSSPSSRLLV